MACELHILKVKNNCIIILYYYTITHWGHPGRGMQKMNQSPNVEAKNRESNWTVIITINQEFDYSLHHQI